MGSQQVAKTGRRKSPAREGAAPHRRQLTSESRFVLLLVLVLVLEKPCKTEHEDEKENEDEGIPGLS
jgi:hypothetical protein